MESECQLILSFPHTFYIVMLTLLNSFSSVKYNLINLGFCFCILHFCNCLPAITVFVIVCSFVKVLLISSLYVSLHLSLLDSSVVPVFGSRCQLVCPERAEDVPVVGSLILMIGVISVATEAIMPMTATVSARGAVEAGEKYCVYAMFLFIYFLTFTAEHFFK